MSSCSFSRIQQGLPGPRNPRRYVADVLYDADICVLLLIMFCLLLIFCAEAFYSRTTITTTLFVFFKPQKSNLISTQERLQLMNGVRGLLAHRWQSIPAVTGRSFYDFEMKKKNKMRASPTFKNENNFNVLLWNNMIVLNPHTHARLHIDTQSYTVFQINYLYLKTQKRCVS